MTWKVAQQVLRDLPEGEKQEVGEFLLALMFISTFAGFFVGVWLGLALS